MANQHIRHERGQALVLITLCAIVLFAALGLVLDAGWARFRQQAAQAAADAAALAGAQTAATSNSSGVSGTTKFKGAATANAGTTSGACTPTCGTNGVTCQAETACPATIPNPPTTNIQAACLYAKANGFAATGSQNITVTANTTSPPPNNPNVSVNYWVTAKVTETQTQLFSAIFGNRYMNTGAHATAAMLPSGGGGCIYVLQSTGSSVTNSGNALLQSGCGIYINSSGPTAVTMSGSSLIHTTNGAKTSIVASGSSAVVTSGTATINPAANLGTTAVADPFASMDPPTVGSCDHSSAVVVTNNQTLSPGTYCGGIITSGTETITLNPGLYIIKSGITESGSPTFNGTGGVTLYFKTGGITGSGTGTFNLNAPTSGTWQGVVLYEDRANTSGITLSGTSGTQVSGLVYMPKGNLTYSGYSGTSGVITTLVVNAITFSGSSYIQQAATTAYGGGGGCPVKLIE